MDWGRPIPQEAVPLSEQLFSQVWEERSGCPGLHGGDCPRAGSAASSSLQPLTD